MEINVLEMFNSISGEVSPYYQGCPTTFIRFAGCNLNCSYCDTPTAHNKGTVWEEKHLIPALSKLFKQTGRLCITGGEPMLQHHAVFYLIKKYPKCWIETNGTWDFSNLTKLIGIVADYKLDNMERIPYYFYNLLGCDFVKFVIGNEVQFQEAIEIQRTLQIGGCKANFAYSPMFDEISPNKLFSWMKKSMLPNTIMNIQIHKYLGMK